MPGRAPSRRALSLDRVLSCRLVTAVDFGGPSHSPIGRVRATPPKHRSATNEPHRSMRLLHHPNQDAPTPHEPARPQDPPAPPTNPTAPPPQALPARRPAPKPTALCPNGASCDTELWGVVCSATVEQPPNSRTNSHSTCVPARRRHHREFFVLVKSISHAHMPPRQKETAERIARIESCLTEMDRLCDLEQRMRGILPKDPKLLKWSP